jgi:hypothetical protein
VLLDDVVTVTDDGTFRAFMAGLPDVKDRAVA